MEMVGSSMITSAAGHNAPALRVSRDGAFQLSKSPTQIESSFPAIGLHLRRNLSSQGVVGYSNFGHGGAQGRAPGLGSSHTVREPQLWFRSVRAGNKIGNEGEETVSESQKAEEEEEKRVDKTDAGFVESIEAELGRQFGGALWFSVLLLSLALFGGVYVFLIINYADFSDIPIFRGPQR